MNTTDAKRILKDSTDIIHMLGAKVARLQAENQLLKTMNTGSNMGFKITQGRGFHMTFDNGWTASVQWGSGNYCENFDLDARSADANAGANGSKTAEIAAWDKDRNWYNFGDDTVKGYVTPNEVLTFLNMVAGF